MKQKRSFFIIALQVAGVVLVTLLRAVLALIRFLIPKVRYLLVSVIRFVATVLTPMTLRFFGWLSSCYLAICKKQPRTGAAMLAAAMALFVISWTVIEKRQYLLNMLSKQVVYLCPNLDYTGSLRERIADGILLASREHRVEPLLIASVLAAESSCRPKVRSGKGAIGLMQLMPATARWLGVNDPFDIHQNIAGGAKYLSYLLKKYHGDRELALAAYNAGPGNIARYAGVPPYRETQNYLKKVNSFYEKSRQLELRLEMEAA